MFSYPIKTAFDKPFIIENADEVQQRVDFTINVLSDNAVNLKQSVVSFDDVSTVNTITADGLLDTQVTISAHTRFYFLLESTGAFAAEVTVTAESNEIRVTRINPLVDVLDEVDLDELLFLTNPIYPVKSSKVYNHHNIFYDNEFLYTFVKPYEAATYTDLDDVEALPNEYCFVDDASSDSEVTTGPAIYKKSGDSWNLYKKDLSLSEKEKHMKTVYFKNLIALPGGYVDYDAVYQDKDENIWSVQEGYITKYAPNEDILFQKRIGLLFNENPTYTTEYTGKGNITYVAKNPFEDYSYIITDNGKMLYGWGETGQAAVETLNLPTGFETGSAIIPYYKGQGLLHKRSGNDTLVRMIRDMRVVSTGITSFPNFWLRKVKIGDSGFFVVGYNPINEVYELKRINNALQVQATTEVDVSDFVFLDGYVCVVKDGKFALLKPDNLSVQRNFSLPVNKPSDYSTTLQQESSANFIVVDANKNVYFTPDNRTLSVYTNDIVAVIDETDAFESLEETIFGEVGVYDIDIIGTDVYMKTFDKFKAEFRRKRYRNRELQDDYPAGNAQYFMQYRASEKIVEQACLPEYKVVKSPFFITMQQDLNGMATLSVMNIARNELWLSSGLKEPVYPFKVFGDRVFGWKSGDSDLFIGSFYKHFIQDADESGEDIAYSFSSNTNGVIVAKNDMAVFFYNNHIIVCDVQDTTKHSQFYVGKLEEPKIKSDGFESIFLMDNKRVEMFDVFGLHVDTFNIINPANFSREKKYLLDVCNQEVFFTKENLLIRKIKNR
jgi:hypothetical protein